jgi:L,D-transpeptidase YcbB
MMAIRRDNRSGFDRRAVIAGFGAFVAAPSAFAAPPNPFGGQAEWSQGYDSGSRITNVRSDAPILSPATVQATEAAIQQYQQVVARGGFIQVRGERLRHPCSMPMSKQR